MQNGLFSLYVKVEFIHRDQAAVVKFHNLKLRLI